MNSLARYRDERGLTDQQIADELAALLGKPMSANGVKLHASRKKTPATWAKALGLPPDEGSSDAADFAAPFLDDGLSGPPPGESPQREFEPPSPPPGARTAPSPTSSPAAGGEFAVVRDRIAKFYGAMGAGVTMITQNDGYASVTEVYSGDLADAWIAAARTNQNVAKIVSFLESGGPVGELVIAHLILVGGMVYVSGRGPALDFLYAGKFAGHRSLAAARAAAAEQEAAYFDGSGANGSAYSVADATAPPTS